MTATSAPTQPYVVFGRPDIQQAEIDEIVDSLRSGWLGTGPKVKRFEQAMAEYVGGRYAVASNSCTASLHVALVALGVQPGDEVVVPTMTFCATANVVCHAGAIPVFVDVDPKTLCVTPEAVAAAMTSRTKVILPVHFAGSVAPVAELRALADRKGVMLLQDAAHCIEGRIDGVSPSVKGHITCYSFYSTKNVATGEGGMAVTDDPALAERLRMLGLHGLDADAWKRFSAEGYRHYECVVPGFKYNMMDLQAALGIHQLARVDAALRVRETQWRRYDEELASLPLDLPAPAAENVRHARHLYTILVRDGARLTRDQLIQGLHQRGIGSGVHYRPVHEHAYYRDRFRFRPDAFPVASDIGRRTVSIPLGPGLTDAEQERVIEALRGLLG